MDVYLKLFIKPKNETEESGPRPKKQGQAQLERECSQWQCQHGMEPSWLAPNWAGVHHPLLASFTLSHSPQGAWLRDDSLVPNGDTKQPHSRVADGLKEPKPQKLSKDNRSSSGCLWLVLALTSSGCECGPNHHYHILQQREPRESKAIPRKLSGHAAEPEHDKSIQYTAVHS